MEGGTEHPDDRRGPAPGNGRQILSGSRTVAPPIEVEYTLHQHMVPPDPSSCSRSANQLVGRSLKKLGGSGKPRATSHRRPTGA